MTGLELRYFVLNPFSSDALTAKASRKAMQEYARVVDEVNVQFADDIYKWVEEAESKD